MSKEPLAKPQLGTCNVLFVDLNVHPRTPHEQTPLCYGWKPLEKPDESGREQAKIEQDAILKVGEELSAAWVKYSDFFCVAPHGTVKQMAAVLELCPNLRKIILDAESIKREAVRETWQTCIQIAYKTDLPRGDVRQIDEAIRSAFEKGE